MQPRDKRIVEYFEFIASSDITYIQIHIHNSSGLLLFAQLRPIDKSDLMITGQPTCDVCECVNPVYVSRSDVHVVPPYFTCENCARIVGRAKDYLASADKFSPRMEKMDYIDDVKYFARMEEVKKKIISLHLLAAGITLKDVAGVISAYVTSIIFAENKLTSNDFSMLTGPDLHNMQ